MKHLNPELEKLESRIAPTLVPIIDVILGGGCGGGDGTNTKGSCSNSHGSGSHGSKSSGSNGSGSTCS